MSEMKTIEFKVERNTEDGLNLTVTRPPINVCGLFFEGRVVAKTDVQEDEIDSVVAGYAGFYKAKMVQVF